MPTWTGQRGARPLFGQSRAANAIVKQAVGSLDQGAQSGVGKSAFGGARGAGVGGGGQVTGSASLLSQIQARERGEDAASESRDVFSSLLREEAAQRGSQVCADNEEGADPVQSRANALIRDLHAFLVERGGRVNSQQVIQHFGVRRRRRVGGGGWGGHATRSHRLPRPLSAPRTASVQRRATSCGRCSTRSRSIAAAAGSCVPAFCSPYAATHCFPPGVKGRVPSLGCPQRAP